ncbi:transglutaminase family protein, partial [Pseudomonas syringae]
RRRGGGCRGSRPRPGRRRGVGADAADAWVAVCCPASGWVGVDPTNNVRPGLEHISLAWGRGFSEVSPLRGVIRGGGTHDPEVRVTVMPVSA